MVLNTGKRCWAQHETMQQVDKGFLLFY